MMQAGWTVIFRAAWAREGRFQRGFFWSPCETIPTLFWLYELQGQGIGAAPHCNLKVSGVGI